MNKFMLVIMAAFVLAVSASTSVAQDDLFLQDQLGGFGDPNASTDPVKLFADFKMKTGTNQGVLNVTAEIIPGWHVFAIKKTEGPTPSKIAVAESKDYKLLGPFTPDKKPHPVEEQGFDEPCLEHEDVVVWSAPFELSENVDPKTLKFKIVYTGQTCESKPLGRCLPLSFDLEGEFDGFDESLNVKPAFSQKPVELKEFQPGSFHATVKGRIVRAGGTDEPFKPGEYAKLELTITPTELFHVYSYSLKKTQYMSTIVGFTETNGWKIKGPEVSEVPEEGEAFGVPAFYHHDPFTLSFFVDIPQTAIANKSYKISGIIGMQACTTTNCDPPTGVAFSVDVPLGSASIVAVQFEKDARYDAAQEAIKAGGVGEPFSAAEKAAVEVLQKQAQKAEAAEQAENAKPDSKPDKKPGKKHDSVVIDADSPEEIAKMAELYDPKEKIKYLHFAEMDENPIGSGGTSSASKTSFWTAMFGAFLGGMILNLMPCVFPVLGLKVMGFVKQAGSDPGKIRMHGLAFTAGLVVSMWILAGAILIAKYSLGGEITWGAQMGNPYFVVGIIVLLFVLGLNMAGVFEIGTSLTGVGGNIQQKSGYTSSFLSGILTTLIATPCSGPFLGAAMSYTLDQPAATAMFLFTIFGLGISSPYLLLSFFPSLISKLPRPGQWMDTFKVTMAFALFATVAFFMQAFGGQTGVDGLTWLAMALVVIGLAAFFYGTWSESHIKPFKRWAFGFVMPALIAGVGIWMCYDAASYKVSHASNHNVGGLQWQAWNPGKIEHSLAKNKKIIWVDYTADW